jgi:hypothetical protein
MGEGIYEIRYNIERLQVELLELGNFEKDIPELINLGNLIRSKEYLSKVMKKQSKLLLEYAAYAKILEGMVSTTLGIQKDLTEILKEQSKLISTPKSKRKSLSKKNKFKSKRK